MDGLYNYLINKTLKSDYFKAWVLAQARHLGTVLGTYLVLHGYGNNEMAQEILGFVLAAANFYLAALDVKLVDGKIKVALNTPVPVTPVEVKELPPVEK